MLVSLLNVKVGVVAEPDGPWKTEAEAVPRISILVRGLVVPIPRLPLELMVILSNPRVLNPN